MREFKKFLPSLQSLNNIKNQNIHLRNIIPFYKFKKANKYKDKRYDFN